MNIHPTILQLHNILNTHGNKIEKEGRTAKSLIIDGGHFDLFRYDTGSFQGCIILTGMPSKNGVNVKGNSYRYELNGDINNYRTEFVENEIFTTVPNIQELLISVENSLYENNNLEISN